MMRSTTRFYLGLAVSAALGYACFLGLEGLTPFPCADNGRCPEPFYCLAGVSAAAAEDGTFEGVCLQPEACDVNAQDCPDPARPKCTRVAVDSAGTVASSCVPLAGEKKQGEPCESLGDINRDSLDDPAYGADDCGPGLACSLAFKYCRTYCAKDTDCPRDHGCSDVGAESYGFCERACTLFADGCPAGQACSLVPGKVNPVTSCVPAGTGPQGSACATARDCAPGSTCAFGTCQPICDASHPCPDGRACVALAGLSGGVGYCGCEVLQDQCGTGGTCRPLNAEIAVCGLPGARRIGEACEVSADCGRDAVCFGSQSNGYFCRRMCDERLECGGEGTCELQPSGLFGACVCQLRASDCGAGRSCKVAGNYQGASALCEQNGRGVVGTPCVVSKDCGSDLVCWGTDAAGYFCRQTCDASLACSGGQSCTAIPGLPNGGGLCLE
jgi:hypothetical protein